VADERGSEQPRGRVPGRPDQHHPPRPTPPPTSRLVTVELSPRSLRLVPGQVETAQVTVRYHGQLVDELAIDLHGELAPFARLAPDELNLYPDTEGQATIRFTPPRAPRPPAGLLELELAVTSRADPTARAILRAPVEIEPFDLLLAETQGSTTQSGSREAVLPIKLRNLGNRPVVAALRAVESAGLAVGLSAASVDLEPGAESTVWANLMPQQPIWFGSSRLFPFTIIASSEFSPPITIDGRFERLPRLGRLRLGLAGLAAGAIVIVGAAGLMLNGGGPPPVTTPTLPAATPTAIANVTDAPTSPPAPATAELTATPSAPPTDSPSAPPTDSPSAPPTDSPSAPPTPVPTIAPAFLEAGDWSLNSLSFPSLALWSISPDAVLSAGGTLTFSQQTRGLVATWTLVAGAKPLTCMGDYNELGQIVAFDASYDVSPLLFQLRGDVMRALCGLGVSTDQAPFTLTSSSARLPLLTWGLSMANTNGTSINWRRSSLVVPSLPALP
jgi:hypothetical protein